MTRAYRPPMQAGREDFPYLHLRLAAARQRYEKSGCDMGLPFQRFMDAEGILLGAVLRKYPKMYGKESQQW